MIGDEIMIYIWWWEGIGLGWLFVNGVRSKFLLDLDQDVSGVKSKFLLDLDQNVSGVESKFLLDLDQDVWEILKINKRFYFSQGICHLIYYCEWFLKIWDFN